MEHRTTAKWTEDRSGPASLSLIFLSTRIRHCRRFPFCPSAFCFSVCFISETVKTSALTFANRDPGKIIIHGREHALDCMMRTMRIYGLYEKSRKPPFRRLGSRQPREFFERIAETGTWGRSPRTRRKGPCISAVRPSDR